MTWMIIMGAMKWVIILVVMVNGKMIEGSYVETDDKAKCMEAASNFNKLNVNPLKDPLKVYRGHCTPAVRMAGAIGEDQGGEQ